MRLEGALDHLSLALEFPIVRDGCHPLGGYNLHVLLDV